MLQLLKEKIIYSILFFKKKQWNKLDTKKVLVAVNDYFSKKTWKQLLINEFFNETTNWDLVFCKNRFDIYLHYPEADACFLYGYSFIFNRHTKKRKLLYFPFLGLDLFNNKAIPAIISIANPPPFSAKAIAEYCLAMAINITRNFQYAIFLQSKKKWTQKLILNDSFISLTEKKIGVLGVGQVGKVIAEYFKNIGCNVVGCDKVIKKDFASIDLWFSDSEIKNFFKYIDLLILALPLNSETRHFIGIEELKCLGKDSYLINISRGDIILEKDLLRALKFKIIKGAVLDTFSNEPLSRYSAYYNLNNVIITPHIAGNINLFVKKIQVDFITKVLINEPHL